VTSGRPTPAITVRGVSKDFGGDVVLDHLDLEVAEGELLAVIGRSGSGKSTLLRIIAGLEDASSGTVTSTARLAVAFQEPRLIPWLTVGDNVTFGLPRAGRRETAEASLAEVGLVDKIDAWPLTLSGGQAQRVALARALVHHPQVLLLDEPFGALDALTRENLQQELKQIWKSTGKSIVFVTHSVQEAVFLGTRVVVLSPRPGRIVYDEPVVYPQPEGAGVNEVLVLPEFAALRAHISSMIGQA